MANTDSIHLLLVEDNPPDALLLRGMLRAPGRYAVTEAASLEDAKAALARQTFDLVLLDLSLPDSLGLATLDKLNAAAPKTPIVVLTGLMDEAVALEAVSHGAQDYLVKGRVDGAQLVRAIRYAIDRKRNETKLHEQAKALARANERLALLSDAAAHLLAAEDPTVMVRELFNKVCAHLNVHAYFNFMVNETGNALRLDSCAGIPDEVARTIEHLDFGVAVCGTVARIRQMIHATAIQQSDDPKVQLVKGYGIRAYCCNPLMAGERLLGTLSFGSCAKDRFDDDEVDFMRTICQYVAMAKERLRLEKELRGHVECLAEADRRKDEFLAMLAHELRNPLAPVRNAVHVLRLAGPKDPTLQRHRDIIERQVTHMARLLDDLLDISRVTRGKITLQQQPLALVDVLAHAVETAAPLITARRHTLQTSLPADSLHVSGDMDRLAQAVGNLLTNAAKYTEPGGQIWLEACRAESADASVDWAVIRVRDSGMGIAPEMLPHVFDLFAQADRTLGHAQGGLGIGLTMVQKLVALHGGTVEARSEGLGRGSEFIIRLPALPMEEPLANEPDTEQTVCAESIARRILVVDDVVDSAETLADLLRLWGHEVRATYSGSSVFDIVRGFKPDLVLLDIGMPDLDGYEVSRRLRQEHGPNHMILVALTGYGQESDRELTRQAGFDHHLVKPVDLDVLEELLEDRL